jgi:tRNA threonylcarbamoyladenosine modification (KEOPS) complex Cgi121 subunit
VMQMQVNSTLCHIEFGTIAGLRRFSRPTRRIKAGMVIMARDRRMTFGTCQIVEALDVIIAETYESIAIYALAIKTPTQSMSIVNLFS